MLTREQERAMVEALDNDREVDASAGLWWPLVSYRVEPGGDRREWLTKEGKLLAQALKERNEAQVAALNAPALLDAAENYEACEEANTALYELLDELRVYVPRDVALKEFTERLLASKPERLEQLRARIAELEGRADQLSPDNVTEELSRGGPWLGAVRKWLTWHVSDTEKWGSNASYAIPFRDFEDLAREVAVAAVEHERTQRARDQAKLRKMWEMERRIAELEAEREWQPIETAPKDGTEVLLLVYGMDTYRSWATDSKWFTELPSGHLFWFDDEDVTHWAPLPKMPEDV